MVSAECAQKCRPWNYSASAFKPARRENRPHSAEQLDEHRTVIPERLFWGEAIISFGFEQFDPLFEPGPATVPAYLVLLNLHDDDVPAIVNQLREAVAASGDKVEDLIGRMLATPNWRVQIIGAAALLIAGSSNGIRALWSALDRPCWTSPQLAAVASRVDPDFLAQASLRLERGCKQDVAEAAEMPWPARHVALGPLSLDAHSAKLAASLAGLCAREEGASLWLTPLMARADLKALIDLDVDEAASIALDWRDEIDRLFVSD